MTVGHLREMDSDEFIQWRILYELEAEDGGEQKKVISDPAEIRRFFNEHG